MTVKTIDRELVRQLRGDFQEVLSQMLADHGLVVTVGAARFTSTTVDFKLAVAVRPEGSGDAPMNAEEVKAASYLRMRLTAESYGADPAWLGRTFTHQGNEFRVAGLTPRRHKKPLMLVRTSDGAVFAAPVALAERYLKEA